ncbi:MAG: hypothetical protein ACRYFK_02545 [Janthinobacterium lividum]
MREPTFTRADFINRVLTSRFPNEIAKRFPFADGEVAALYTLGRNALTGVTQPVILYVATFPPALAQAGARDYGIDYYEHAVASAAEATELLTYFDWQQAAAFRASCRAA